MDWKCCVITLAKYSLCPEVHQKYLATLFLWGHMGVYYLVNCSPYGLPNKAKTKVTYGV